MSTPTRCPWVDPANALYVAYHDAEWGVPVHDDRVHIEFLLLEGAQAGLSWKTILRRREHYRRAFADFDPAMCGSSSDAGICASRASRARRSDAPASCGEHTLIA